MAAIINLQENEGIAVGDVVRIKGRPDRGGVVTAIVDYGTHVCYFINLGLPIKFPAKREWIELVEKAKLNHDVKNGKPDDFTAEERQK